MQSDSCLHKERGRRFGLLEGVTTICYYRALYYCPYLERLQTAIDFMIISSQRPVRNFEDGKVSHKTVVQAWRLVVAGSHLQLIKLIWETEEKVFIRQSYCTIKYSLKLHRAPMRQLCSWLSSLVIKYFDTGYRRQLPDQSLIWRLQDQVAKSEKS